MAEYYFDSKIEVLNDGLNVCDGGLPKMHIERDYYTDGVKYEMYLTFPQWNAKKGDNSRNTRFDSAKVLFDIRGISIETVAKEDEKELAKREIEVNKTMSFDQYKKAGFRFPVVSDEEDYSGVGKIVLKKVGVSESTVMYIAVNFGFKRKIKYQISGGKILFEGKNIKDEIGFKIHYAEDRYPCLLEDKRSNSFQSISVDFSTPATMTYAIPESLKEKSLYLSFDGGDPTATKELEKYYLLECKGNDTLQAERRDFARPDLTSYFCPYCHEKIENGPLFQSKYMLGGVACNGHRIYDGGKPVALTGVKGKGKKAKNAMYCADDLGTEKVNKHDTVKKPNANSLFARLLPDNFFTHKHFKIVVVGSARAGKTTFLSRLFDVSGSEESTEMTAKMLVNGTKKNFELMPYAIKEMDKLSVSRNAWYKNKKIKFYSDYSIDIAKGIYPEKTDKLAETQLDKTKDVMKYPFVLESNKDTYVYFYDIAGEDAEQSTNRLGKMMLGAPAGIFYLVDGRLNVKGNDSVFQRIQEVIRESKTSYPIAVILTKFDMVESGFDENCHCLRSDVYDMMDKSFEGSLLEQNIDLASEEIKSYLKTKGIHPDFGPNANVKYFGVSSFSATDAVHHEDKTEDSPEINYLTHRCSSKRMELPVIWMLKQFGCIV